MIRVSLTRHTAGVAIPPYFPVLRIGIPVPVPPGFIAELRQEVGGADVEIYIVDMDDPGRWFGKVDQVQQKIGPIAVPPLPKLEGAMDPVLYEYKTPLESLQKNHKRYKKRKK